MINEEDNGETQTGKPVETIKETIVTKETTTFKRKRGRPKIQK